MAKGLGRKLRAQREAKKISGLVGDSGYDKIGKPKSKDETKIAGAPKQDAPKKDSGPSFGAAFKAARNARLAGKGGDTFTWKNPKTGVTKTFHTYHEGKEFDEYLAKKKAKKSKTQVAKADKSKAKKAAPKKDTKVAKTEKPKGTTQAKGTPNKAMQEQSKKQAAIRLAKNKKAKTDSKVATEIKAPMTEPKVTAQAAKPDSKVATKKKAEEKPNSYKTAMDEWISKGKPKRQ